jgi:hypothetical protein
MTYVPSAMRKPLHVGINLTKTNILGDHYRHKRSSIIN